MKICPRCGFNITTITQTRSIVGKQNKTGQNFNLNLGFSKCPKCYKKLMMIQKKDEESIIDIVKEIKEIEKGFKKMLDNLKEKIEKLKNERAQLLKEIEELKRTGEIKANNLEKEITSLREEIESLKKILEENEWKSLISIVKTIL